jgi:hypothetical protein
MMIAFAFGLLLGLQLDTPHQTFGTGLGVCAHLNDLTDKDTARMRADGFSLARTDIPWAEVERKKGVFDFSRYDQIAANISKHGLKPLFILDYGNTLYGEETPRSSEGIEAFVNYAVAAAQHFRRYHPMWEIWNEPDHPAFWKPAPNAEEYARLAIATARGVKQAVPDAKIVALGLTKLDWPFMKAAADAGLLNDIDYVSVHMYRFVRPETAIGDYDQVKQFIAGYHPSHRVGVMCTEWGYPLTYPGQDESRQGSYVVRCYLAGLIAGVDATFLYEWNDTPMAPGQTQGHFGLHNPEGHPRLGLDEFANLTGQLQGFQMVSEEHSGDTYEIMFKRGGREKVVAWTVALDPEGMGDVNRAREEQKVRGTVLGREVDLSPMPQVFDQGG